MGEGGQYQIHRPLGQHGNTSGAGYGFELRLHADIFGNPPAQIHIEPGKLFGGFVNEAERDHGVLDAANQRAGAP